MIPLQDKFNIYPVIETDNLKIPLYDFLDQIISAGVNIIQLRDKFHTSMNRYITAKKIKEFLSNKKDVIFIVNDSIDIALAVDADGVHLGIKDIPIHIARSHFKNLIFGYSCNNLVDIDNANKYADYVGIGPCFYTDTKKDLRDLLSPNQINDMITSLDLPAFAIGGINDKNIMDIKSFGFDGVAVSSYITTSMDPYNAIIKLNTVSL